MPYEIRIDQQKRWVVIENRGTMTHEDFVRQAKETHELLKQTGYRRAISNCVELKASVDTTDIFLFPELYSSLGIPRDFRVAIVVPADLATSKDVRFYETVCRNRGWQFKVASTLAMAEDWLQQQPVGSSVAK